MALIKIDNRFNSVEAQIARKCGTAVDEEITDVRSLFGSHRCYAQIFKLKSGKFMTVSANDFCADYALSDEMLSYDSDVYSEDREYDAICAAAGITRPADLPVSARGMREFNEDYRNAA